MYLNLVTSGQKSINICINIGKKQREKSLGRITLTIITKAVKSPKIIREIDQHAYKHYPNARGAIMTVSPHPRPPF